MSCMNDLIQIGFKIRGLVTDNHSTNVAAFNILLNENDGDKKQHFCLPNADQRTYIFFDSVHLVKNIRNNLLNEKKFVFPEFNFTVCGLHISSSPGYISWHDLHRIHERDQKLQACLKGLLDYAIKIAATWVACKKLHARIARPFTLRIQHRAIFKISL